MGSARTGGRVYLLRIMTSFLCCAFFGHIHLVAVKFFIHPQPEFMLQIAFHIKSVLLIEVRQFFVPLMLGNVEFVAQEWSDSAQLQDALAAIHDRKFVPAHKFFATMSSDELKKVATIKEFLFVATILIIFQPVSYCLTCIIREYEL